MFSYVFIYVLDLVVMGAGLAFICTNFCNIVLELSYIFIFKPFPESFFFFNKDSFSLQGLWDFMKVYGALLPITLSWSWSQEIQMIIASTLGKLNLASHVVLSTIANMSLSISYGSSFSVAILVGFYLGKKEVEKIKTILYFSWTFAVIVVGLLIIVLTILRVFIIKSFLTDPYIVDLALKCFPFLCLYQNLQAFNDTFYGWFRSIGQRVITIVIALVSYFVILLATSLVLTQVLNLHVYGIWIANVVAEGFSVLVLLIFFFVLDIESSCKELIKVHDEEDKSRGEHMINKLDAGYQQNDNNDSKDNKNNKNIKEN